MQTVVAVLMAQALQASAASSRAYKVQVAPKPAPSPAATPPSSAACARSAKAAPARRASGRAEGSHDRPCIAGKVRSSPLVRRMARENDIDLSQVPGTGAGGRVSKQDILGAIEGGASSRRRAAPARSSRFRSASAARRLPPRRPTLETAVPREKMYFGQYEVQPMSVMRQRIAEHMVLSKRVSPHVYSVDEVDVTAIAALRAKMKDEVRARARDQAHLHAVLHPRRRRSACAPSRPSMPRSTAPTSFCTRNATSASPSRSIGD